MDAVRPAGHEIEYRYVGSGFVPGIPADDLTAAQVDRLVFIRTTKGGRRGLRPGDEGFDAALEGVCAKLELSGLYEPVSPVPAPKPKAKNKTEKKAAEPATEPVETPQAPAVETAEGEGD